MLYFILDKYDLVHDDNGILAYVHAGKAKMRCSFKCHKENSD